VRADRRDHVEQRRLGFATEWLRQLARVPLQQGVPDIALERARWELRLLLHGQELRNLRQVVPIVRRQREPELLRPCPRDLARGTQIRLVHPRAQERGAFAIADALDQCWPQTEVACFGKPGGVPEATRARSHEQNRHPTVRLVPYAAAG